MTREEILAGESKNVEFKKNPPDKSIKYMKSVVVFANGSKEDIDSLCQSMRLLTAVSLAQVQQGELKTRRTLAWKSPKTLMSTGFLCPGKYFKK